MSRIKYLVKQANTMDTYELLAKLAEYKAVSGYTLLNSERIIVTETVLRKRNVIN